MADSLAKLASSGDTQLMELIPVEQLDVSSIDQMEVEAVFETEPEKESWMTPIKNYILHGTLPEKGSERRKVFRKASRYIVQGGILYRIGFSMPLLRCVVHDDIKRVLREVHEGACGDDTGGQTLAKKILRYGYFLPTVNRDAADYSRKCDRCQRYVKISRAPPAEIIQMVSPWPFAT